MTTDTPKLTDMINYILSVKEQIRKREIGAEAFIFLGLIPDNYIKKLFFVCSDNLALYYLLATRRGSPMDQQDVKLDDDMRLATESATDDTDLANKVAQAEGKHADTIYRTLIEIGFIYPAANTALA